MPQREPCRQCGQPERDGRTCVTAFHELLAREQQSPELALYHGVVVPCYFLQHSDDLPDGVRDAQWRLLHVFVERGIEGIVRAAKHLRRMNSHRHRGPLSIAILDEFEGVPDILPPRSFDVTVEHLAGRDWSFPIDGYGGRVRAFVDATLRAWRHAALGQDYACSKSARYGPSRLAPE